MKKKGIIIGVILFIILIIVFAIGTHDWGVDDESALYSTQTVVVSSGSDYDIGLYEIVDDSIIDTSVEFQVADGVITDKVMYLSGVQIVYSLEITFTGFSQDTMIYFCTRKTYDSILLGDSVEVTYQKVTDSAFAVYSVINK